MTTTAGLSASCAQAVQRRLVDSGATRVLLGCMLRCAVGALETALRSKPHTTSDDS